MSDQHTASPDPIKLVAELANRLATTDPDARRIVSELFAAFQAVKLHYQRPQSIKTVPREPGIVLQLHCPTQGGWHYGEWCSNGHARWVAVIDKTIELTPNFWLPPEPDPATHGESLTCGLVKVAGLRNH